MRPRGTQGEMHKCTNARMHNGADSSCALPRQLAPYLHSCISAFMRFHASERMSDAEFERVRLAILVARENPGQPIAFLVFEQDDLIVDRCAETAGERQV